MSTFLLSIIGVLLKVLISNVMSRYAMAKSLGQTL